MYAVVRTGGKQYRVSGGDVFSVEKLPGSPGEVVALDDVLLVSGDSGIDLGAKVVVKALIVDQVKADKIIVFKKRRRHNYRRKAGHRQPLTVLRVTAIGDQVFDVPSRPKPDRASDVSAPAAPIAEVSGTLATSDALPVDNLSLISGIGPAIEKKLRAVGIQTWHDIAGWSEEDVQTLSENLKLGGRVAREEWIEQAKELLAGNPPRAKLDQAEAKSKRSTD